MDKYNFIRVSHVTNLLSWIIISSHFKAQWLLHTPTLVDTEKFCVLPVQCIYVILMDLRTNSDYFIW